MPRKRLPETEPPEDLTRDQKRKLIEWAERKISEGQLPSVYSGRKKLRQMVNECLAYHVQNDIWRRNWLGTMQKWILKQPDIDHWKRLKKVKEKPKESGHRAGATGRWKSSAQRTRPSTVGESLKQFSLSADGDDVG